MSRPPARRPILLPALRRLWRDSHRLQLGTDPGRAIILELADPSCARLLDLLDGNRTEAAVLKDAARHGIAPDAATAMLVSLRTAGVVVDARMLRPSGLAEPTRRRLDRETAAVALRGRARASAEVIRRRLAARVLVTGASQLVVPIACTLAASGVGHLDPDVTGVARLADIAPAGLLPSDAHRPRGVAAAEAVRRAAPDVDLGPLRTGEATFVVVVGFTAPAALTALSLGSRRLAHLAVSIRDACVVVGPLVRPGQTPCLNCLDLHRADRDPAWGRIAAQLHTAPDQTDPVAAATALAASAYAAAEVLAHIDGGVPATLGATVEITEPGHTSRRRWSVHPTCGCPRGHRSAHR